MEKFFNGLCMTQKTIIFGVAMLVTILAISGWVWSEKKFDNSQGSVTKQIVSKDGDSVDGWKTIRGDNLKWLENGKEWLKDWNNISLQVPQDAEVGVIAYDGMEIPPSWHITIPSISPLVSISVVPNLDHVQSQDGDVTIIAKTFKDVDFGNLSEQFSKYSYHDVKFSHMKGIQLPPIRRDIPELNINEYYIDTYTLIKTTRDTKPNQYAIYKFSLYYDSEETSEKIQQMEDIFTKILDTVQPL